MTMLYRKFRARSASLVAGKVLSVSSRRRLSVLFYGSDEFSLPALEHMVNKKAEIWTGHGLRISRLEVVCKGKDLPVKAFAKSKDLPVHNWPYTVPQDTFDVGVVVSFGHLIPKESIQSCVYGMINVHPSLLPRWRGAAPLHHTIISDDKVTGVSIIDVAPDLFDVGKILLQKSMPLPDRITLPELDSLLAENGAQLLMQCLSDLPHYRSQSWAQGDQGVTRAPKVTKIMARVRWSMVTAQQVDCLHRGLPFPLYTFWERRKVCLLHPVNPQDASLIPFDRIFSQKGAGTVPCPGSVAYDKRTQVLGVRTGVDSGWAAFGQVILKQTMTARDFNNGFLSKVSPDQRFFMEDGQEDDE